MSCRGWSQSDFEENVDQKLLFSGARDVGRNVQHFSHINTYERAQMTAFPFIVGPCNARTISFMATDN